MSRRKVFIGVGILIIVASTLVGYFRFRVVSHQFVGAFERVEGDAVITTGRFISEEHPEINTPDHNKTVKVLITPETQIVKILLQLPQSGGFYADDLPKEEKIVTLQELSQEKFIDLNITAAGNIYNKSEFKAQRIEYRVGISSN